MTQDSSAGGRGGEPPEAEAEAEAGTGPAAEAEAGTGPAAEAQAENGPGTGPENENGGAGSGGAVTDPAQAAELLSDVRRLRRAARSARHAYWFPLVLFGLLTFLAVPFYVLPGGPSGRHSFTSRAPAPYLPLLGGAPGFLTQNYLGYYWLVALLAGLTLTLLWYRRHARRIGLRTPSRGYLITVAVLTGLALVLPILAQSAAFGWLRVLWPGDLTIRGTFPFLIIAIGLCVLAWAERSRALAVIAVVYTGTALLVSLYDVENILFRLGWNPSSPYQWQLTSLPNILLPALILVVAGVGAFIAQRRRQSPA